MSARPRERRTGGLSVGGRIVYAAPAFALAVVGIPVYVHLPKFYTDVIGVSVGAVGALVMAARLFDAVTDPLIGLASDRTRSRWGRRRPWIALGSIPLAVSLVALFAPPEASGTTAAIWLGGSLFATFLFWTVVTVPYESLGPELTFDFHERTAVLALRDGALIAGTLVAAAAPVIVGGLLGLGTGAAAERTRFLVLALGYGALVLAVCWVAAARLRERDRRPVTPAAPARAMLRNRPFLILLASYAVGALGSNLPAVLLLYYVEYVLGSTAADLFLVEYLLTGVVFLPAWVALSRRLGKKRAWILSMALNTGAFAGVFLLGPGDVAAYGILVFLSGIGLGATLAIPSSLQADVIDYDELLTGERREGRYVGIWSVTRKAVAALSVGAALPILGAVGYVPNQPQGPEVVFTLRLLYAAVPSLCNLAAILIALAYPIGRDEQVAILDAVEERRRGRPVSDPLRPDVVLGSPA